MKKKCSQKNQTFYWNLGGWGMEILEKVIVLAERCAKWPPRLAQRSISTATFSKICISSPPRFQQKVGFSGNTLLESWWAGCVLGCCANLGGHLAQRSVSTATFSKICIPSPPRFQQKVEFSGNRFLESWWAGFVLVCCANLGASFSTALC